MINQICETDVSSIPEKYKRASDKKIARKLKKLPPPIPDKKPLVLQTPRGKIII